MSNVILTNFGEYTSAGDFFENESSTGASFSASNYSSASVFGFSNGNGKAFVMTNNTPTVTKNVPAASEYYCHIRAQHPDSTAVVLMRFDEGTTNHVDVIWNADGTISARRSGTVLATGSSIFPRLSSTVLSVQIRVVIHDTTGVVQVRCVGGGAGSATSNEINVTGADTRNAGTGVINRIGFIRAGSPNFTDFVVNNTSGSDNNSWTGACRVITAFPNANGASGVQFTPSAGNNIDNVDDPIGLHDGDATYNESSTDGHKDWFGYPAFTMSALSIALVKHKYWARATDAGTHTMRGNAKNGGTTVNGITTALGSSFSEVGDNFPTDPSTGAAWASLGAVAGAEFGYERVS